MHAPALTTPLPMSMPASMPMTMSPTNGMQQPPVYVSSLEHLPPGAMPIGAGQGGSMYGRVGAYGGVDAYGGIGAYGGPRHHVSLLGSTLAGAAMGGVAGAALGAITPLSLMTGGLIGAGVGAALGLVRGLMKRRSLNQQMMGPAMGAAMAPPARAWAGASHMALPAAATPGATSGPGVATAGAGSTRRAQGGVVMGPEMRRKWAAQVAAQRASTEAAPPARA